MRSKEDRNYIIYLRYTLYMYNTLYMYVVDKVRIMTAYLLVSDLDSGRLCDGGQDV